MPARRYVTVVVRCEDLQQRCFIYRYLTEKGLHYRTISIQHCPRGRGDAKQWVREQYVLEVRVLRAKTFLATGTIAMLDADVDSVEDRKKELDAALRNAGQEARRPDEPIAVVVPRRNIETWIHHLLGQAVNEEDSYPHLRGEESRCAPAVAEFVGRCPGAMTSSDPPSLRDGCQELTRFLAFQQKG